MIFVILVEIEKSLILYCLTKLFERDCVTSVSSDFDLLSFVN